MSVVHNIRIYYDKRIETHKRTSRVNQMNNIQQPNKRCQISKEI